MKIVQVLGRGLYDIQQRYDAFMAAQPSQDVQLAEQPYRIDLLIERALDAFDGNVRIVPSLKRIQCLCNLPVRTLT
jgi:hypothetical protein